MFRVELIYDYLEKTLFWNMIIRLILEGYLEYSISAVINCENVRSYYFTPTALVVEC